MKSVRIARPSAALAALLLLVAHAPAQVSTPAQATKALKTVVKFELKNLKKQLATEVADFSDAAHVFQDAVTADEPDLVAAAQELAAAWTATEVAMHSWMSTHREVVIINASDILGEYQAAAGGIMGGPYPFGFHPGDGGALDDFEQGVRDAAEKARDKLQTRLGKLSQPLSKAGLKIGVQVRPLLVLQSFAFNADAADDFPAILENTSFSIDLLLTLDPVEGTGDALIVLAGNCPPSAAVHVDVGGPGGLPALDADVAGSVAGRWEAILGAVHEGNYSVSGTNSDDPSVVHDQLGAG